jgi:twitching motility protein PilT
MQTFDQSIFNLYKKDLITYDEALRRASNPDEFKLKIQGIQSTSDLAQEEMEKSMSDFMDDKGGEGAESPFEFS